MNRHATKILLATAMLAAAPIVVAPTASADVCASAGGRHFSAGGCTDIAGDVAGAAIAAQHVPYVPGEIPCYTVEGVPYFTPPGDPC